MQKNQLKIKLIKNNILFILSGAGFSALIFQLSLAWMIISLLALLLVFFLSMAIENLFLKLKQSNIRKKIISLIFASVFLIVCGKNFYDTWIPSGTIQNLTAKIHLSNSSGLTILALILCATALLFTVSLINYVISELVNYFSGNTSGKHSIIFCSFAISFFQTILGMYGDDAIFLQQSRNSVRYSIYRIVYIIIITVIWYYILCFTKRILQKEKRYLIYLLSFLIYFTTFSIVLVCIWPGHWVWDEQSILKSATNLQLLPWQHIITSFFYIFALMIIPSPVFIVVAQYSIISIIISFFLGNLYERYGKKSVFIGIAFLLPSIVVNVFYPMRLILFAFFELLFFFLLLKHKNNKTVKGNSLVILLCLNILLATWRTECIFFVIILPLYFAIMKYSKKFLVLITVTIFAFSGLLVMLQNACLNRDGDRVYYSVTGIVQPFNELLKTEYAEDPNSKIINDVSSYLDVEKAIRYSDGVTAFREKVYERVRTDSDFKVMFGNFCSLLQKHPGSFFEDRINMLKGSMCFWDDNSKLISVVRGGNFRMDIFNLENYNNCCPINSGLRFLTLNILYANTGNNVIDFFIELSYNIAIPAGMVLFFFICSIISLRKKIVILIISCSLLIQNILVFLTAPAPFFMYYYPLLVCVYPFFVLRVIDMINNHKLQKRVSKGCNKNESVS